MAGEPVGTAKRVGAELAAGVDLVGEAVEDEAIDRAAGRTHRIGVVPSVLGEGEFGRRADERLGERAVEERRVLVGVDDLGAAGVGGGGEFATRGKVPPRAAVEADDIDAFAAQFLADGADAVEAENRGRDRAAECADGLADQHLRAGDLHDVDHERDADRGGGRGAGVVDHAAPWGRGRPW